MSTREIFEWLPFLNVLSSVQRTVAWAVIIDRQVVGASSLMIEAISLSLNCRHEKYLIQVTGCGTKARGILYYFHRFWQVRCALVMH
jgi:hypothetical protein